MIYDYDLTSPTHPSQPRPFALSLSLSLSPPPPPPPQVAAESGREIKEVESEVRDLLEEIGHKMMLPAVRSLALPIRATVKKILHGVYVNTKGVEQVERELHFSFTFMENMKLM